MTPDERAALYAARQQGSDDNLYLTLGWDEAIWRAAKAFWLERAAKENELTRSQVSLRAGELTNGEWRTVRAIMADRARAIRALAQEAEG